MKKFTAILLAVVMVFALGASAFAADTNDTLSSFTFTDFNLTVSVSTTNEGLTLSGSGRSATIAADTGRDIPQAFSLIFSNADGSNFDTSSVTVTTSRAAIFDFYTEGEQDPKYGYGVVELYGDKTEITIKRDGVDGQCMINVPTPTAQVAGQGLVAYLPAPGQFVNEGANGSGWGGPFTAKDASTLKGIVEGYVTTGVSLGAFGGYVVMDFGEPAKDSNGKVTGGIFNDPTNAYGVDFTLYGNAMSSWAEPGVVQVSKNGTKWYTLAGSLHYQTPVYTYTDAGVYTVTKSGAEWNYEAVYTNPVPADDGKATGEMGTTGTNVPYTFTGAGTGSGSVVFNNWHQHSYFPLYNNYFVSVNGHTLLSGIKNTVEGLDLNKYVEYNNEGSAATLTMRGVRLFSEGNSYAPDKFLFGYADSHPNGLLTTEQVNPYTTGRTSNSNSNGDPMDLSWAVDDDGTPVYLDSVRYVRVYTGVQQMNGIMGESSTEILGSHRATKKGATAAVKPTITLGGLDLDTLAAYGASVTTSQVENSPNQQIITISGTSAAIGTSFAVQATGGTYVYMNGAAATTTDVTVGSGTTLVQIINQTGEGNPYITLLKISA